MERTVTEKNVKKTEKNRVERLELRIHPDLKRRFKRHCKQHHEKMSEVIINYIKQHIGFK